MDYIELNCTVNPVDEYVEIVIARLAEIGYEMFEETEKGVKAYISTDRFTHEYKNEFDDLMSRGIELTFAEKVIPSQNWNAVWESNFDPLVIDETVFVRAEFHPEQNQYPYTIVIHPKMAFGTGHHATTALMMEAMLKVDFAGKTVLDMGCGTGILAILSSMLGAKDVDAIDNDPVAVENADENGKLNGTEINVMKGDAGLIEKQKFDIILANINRNIITSDIKRYAEGLKDNGLILLSGFYVSDVDAIKVAAGNAGLLIKEEQEKDKWACLTFNKK